MWEWNSWDRATFKDNLQALLTVCCFMLTWESGCNLVTSIASFVCVISKQWSFSGSEGQFTYTASSRTVLSQKTSGSFGAVKKAADTEFAGDDSAILISVCVSASLRFRFPTWHLKSCTVTFSRFPHRHATCSHRCGFLFTSVSFKQNTQVSKERHY